MVRIILAALVICSLLPCAAAADFKVGMVLPLSGPVGAMGTAFQRGVEMYREEHGPGAAEFLFEDHRYDGKSAVTAVEKLYHQNGVRICVVWGNTPSAAVVPLSETKSIPMVAVTFDPLAKGRKNVIAFGPLLSKMIENVDLQFKRWEVQQAAALSIDIGDALDSIEDLKRLRNGKLIIRTIANEETDFKTQIAALKSQQVDGLVLITLVGQAITFLKQAAAQNFTPKIISGDVFADEEFLRSAAELNPDVAFVYGAVDDAFIGRMRKRWKSSSYFFEAASGYSLAAMMDRAAADQGRSPAEALKNIDLRNLPLQSLTFANTPELGAHFEAGQKVYFAPAAERPRN